MSWASTRQDRDTLDRASDLGIAFQLANIARDIVEDAQVGRTYLPADWLADEASTALDLADPAHRHALARSPSASPPSPTATARSSKVGAARLPFRSRWAVLSAPPPSTAKSPPARSTLGPRAWDQRISISKAEKFALVVEAFAEALLPGAQGQPRRAVDAARRRPEPAPSPLAAEPRPSAPRPAARR